MLNDKNYLSDPLTKEFKDNLNKYSNSTIASVVGLLLKHEATQLGQAEFDVESYDIDANGNHKHYYTGYERYEMKYNKNNNQIQAVSKKSFHKIAREISHEMEHDDLGNVIKASHKGIKKIEYDKVSNRVTRFIKDNGMQISFRYDALGFRVSKRVTDANGNFLREIQYIRDSIGRVLSEKEIVNMGDDIPLIEVTTVYVYGPRGMLGFYRNGKFFVVLTDHEGSTRLVVQDNKVVAAYDYLPYGGLMRKLDSKGLGVRYRYTGQEWDEELGLYFFRARFYDPEIGRFFQVDPRNQYPSPYKFAGNSPVSVIDPDGEFAFLLPFLAVGLAIGGAYLGGAAANKSWNPLKWDWKSTSTWLGIIGGGIAGAVAPFAAVQSAGLLVSLGLSQAAAWGIVATTGVAFAFGQIASSQGSWNPAKWDFKSPELWSSLFLGATSGVGILSVTKSLKSFVLDIKKFLTLGVLKKFAFIGKVVINIGSGAGSFVLNGFATKWDINNPAFWVGSISAVIGASGVPKFFKDSKEFYARNLVNLYKQLKKQKIVASLLLGTKLFGGVATLGVSVYLHGDAATDGKWDFKDVSTYDGIINGLTSSNDYIDAGRMAKHIGQIQYRESVIRQSNDIANHAVAIYKDLNTNYQTHLTGADIAVYKTGNLHTVVIKTDNGPDLVMWTDKKKSNAEFINYNKNQGDYSTNIKLSNNEAVNNLLHKAIETTQLDLKRENIQIFDTDIIPKINEALDVDSVLSNYQTDITQNKIKNLDVLREIITKQGFVDLKNVEGAVRSSFDNAISSNQNEINKMLHNKRRILDSSIDLKEKNKILAKIDQQFVILNDDSPEVTNNKINEAKFKIDHELKTLENIKYKIKEVQNNAIGKVLDKDQGLAKYTENMESNWIKNDPLRSAEVKALSSYFETPPKFSKVARKGFIDGEIMLSYKLSDQMNLVPKAEYNKIIQENTKIKINDLLWYEKLGEWQKDFEEYYMLYKPKQQILIATEEGKNPKKRSIINVYDEDLDSYEKQSKNALNQNISRRFGILSLFRRPINAVTTFVQNLTKPLIHPEFTDTFEVPRLTSNNGFDSASSNITRIDRSNLQLNSNLLLLDVIARKLTKQRYMNPSTEIDPFEAQLISMNIIENFENVALELYGIDINEFLNVSEIQTEIYNAIMTENYKNVPYLLMMYLEEIIVLLDQENFSDDIDIAAIVKDILKDCI
ncbi:uncharacterized protein LOC113384964 [Ctenocephalides felis]|uniref:uncharacterized protein LOC113384964 n=1 Tax=Ctenocephalides felis TaxID=7515 RepID=UPI000E6E2F8E|nr:uncharacterized protein LOC113384964 [Ctenocephalides felis]